MVVSGVCQPSDRFFFFFFLHCYSTWRDYRLKDFHLLRKKFQAVRLLLREVTLSLVTYESSYHMALQNRNSSICACYKINHNCNKSTNSINSTNYKFRGVSGNLVSGASDRTKYRSPPRVLERTQIFPCFTSLFQSALQLYRVLTQFLYS